MQKNYILHQLFFFRFEFTSFVLRVTLPAICREGKYEFRSKVSRSTIADANEARDYRIFQDFGYVLIGTAQELYKDEDLAVDLKQPLFAFDSTTIDLCLLRFPWAEFRETKAAVKMHTLLDLRGSILSFVAVTTGKVSDVTVLDDLPIKADS